MSLSLPAAIHMDIIKIGLLLFGVSSILMGFIIPLKKLFMKNKKKFFIYMIFILCFFALNGLLSNKKVLNDIPLNNFIGFQIIFLLLGCVHVIVLRRFFPDLIEKLTSFWPEFLYTIVTAFLGLISFLFVVNSYKPDYQFIFTLSILWFIIPYFIVKLYEYAISIPLPIYKKWFYPLDKNIKDPKDEELNNPLVISFEFNKGSNQDELSNFRLKAPEKMEFGTLFYFFINDYNDRHPEAKIEYVDAQNAPHGWIFYKKAKWLSFQKHIDFTRTIEGNNIKEDDIIICQRA